MVMWHLFQALVLIVGVILATAGVVGAGLVLMARLERETNLPHPHPQLRG